MAWGNKVDGSSEILCGIYLKTLKGQKYVKNKYVYANKYRLKIW